MGSTLYNKIYLGRSSVLGSRSVQLALVIGVLAGVGLGWLVLRSLR